ncbi:hypothetical protein D3C81_1770860 [compost metagenome]
MRQEEVLRLAFLQDVESVIEKLYRDIANIDREESVDDILHLLYALRLAAIAYNERSLKRNVEHALAVMLNRRLHQTKDTVMTLYQLADTMLYPMERTALSC